MLAAALGIALFVLGQVFTATYVLRYCVNGGPWQTFRCQAPIVMLKLGVILCLLTLMEVVVSALWIALRSWRDQMIPRRWIACLAGAFLTVGLQLLCAWLVVLADEKADTFGPLMFLVVLAWWCVSLPAIPFAGHGNWTLAYLVVFWGLVGALVGARLDAWRDAARRSGQG